MAWRKLGSFTRWTFRRTAPRHICKARWQSSWRIESGSSFAARDAQGKSYPAHLDVDRSDPLRVLEVREQRIVPVGPAGTFDEDGNMPASVIESGGVLWLYYTGWNARVGVPYHNSIGVAISRDEGRSFERMFDWVYSGQNGDGSRFWLWHLAS